MTTTGSERKFEFIREIASGGFGSVYLAKMLNADGFARLVAVKLLHPKWSENHEVASRMRDEARLLGWLRHRNIVEVLDLTRLDGRVGVIMEYLEAIDLKYLIGVQRRTGDLVPLRACLEVAAAAASALDAAYNRPPYEGKKPLRVIHRDIKPSNIMIDTGGAVKVLDFGVARADFEAREARTAELSFGSVQYMAPERLFFEPDTHAGDVYSLGTLLFELLALESLGKAKLQPEAHEDLVVERYRGLLEARRRGGDTSLDDESEVVARFETLLGRMLAFEQDDRPSAGECATEIRSISRALPGVGLEEWAEQVVPLLVRQVQARRTEQQDGLLGQILDEERTGGRPVEPGPPERVRAAAQGLPDDPADRSTVTDAPATPGAPVTQPSGVGLKEWVVVLGSLAVGAAMLGLGILALGVALWGSGMGQGEVEPEPGDVQAAGPAAEPEEVDSTPAEDAPTFTAGSSDVRRLTVRCGGAGSKQGEGEVVVPGAEGNCVVTAVFEDRRRATAIVADVEPRSYTCFGDDERACR